MKDISTIDKNLKVESDIREDGIVWFDVKDAPFSIFGMMYDQAQGCYVRMPQAVADKVSEGVANLNRQTAGGRVRFKTDSPFIGMKAEMDHTYMMPHMPLAGQSGFDLYRDTAQGSIYCHTFMPPVELRAGYSSAFREDGKNIAQYTGDTEYTINFPLYDGVKNLYIALKKDATLAAARPYADVLPIVYYGSSITQGGCASRPGNSYQAIISRKLDMDFVNLGFSGSCRGERAMAEYLAALPMGIFVCDYDHNAPNADYLEKTHLSLYRAVRRGHPDVPIVFISAPDILLKGNISEFCRRREIVAATYGVSVAEGDKNTYLIDGETLFAGDGWDSCTVDGTHPNDLGFYKMAVRIGAEIEKIIYNNKIGQVQ